MRFISLLCLLVAFSGYAQQSLNVDDYIKADSLNKELEVKQKLKDKEQRKVDRELSEQARDAHMSKMRKMLG